MALERRGKVTRQRGVPALTRATATLRISRDARYQVVKRPSARRSTWREPFCTAGPTGRDTTTFKRSTAGRFLSGISGRRVGALWRAVRRT
jgi:hypothetical protein